MWVKAFRTYWCSDVVEGADDGEPSAACVLNPPHSLQDRTRKVGDGDPMS